MKGVIDVKKIEPILEEYGVTYAGLFGSYARGEARGDSDIDIMIKLRKPIGLFKLAGLEIELSDALKKKVDLVTEGGIGPYIRESVMSDLRQIYGA
jgi:uncharacterized protein